VVKQRLGDADRAVDPIGRAVAAEAEEPAMTYQTTTRVSRSPTATSPSRGWLTAVLRPAGTLDNLSTAALGALLADLSAAADMVVVDPMSTNRQIRVWGRPHEDAAC
jgi:hypothetical protein